MHKEHVLLSVGYKDMAYDKISVGDFAESTTHIIETLLKKDFRFIVCVIPPVHPFTKGKEHVFMKSCEICGELLRLTALYGIKVVNINRFLFSSDDSTYDLPCDGSGFFKYGIKSDHYYFN